MIRGSRGQRQSEDRGKNLGRVRRAEGKRQKEEMTLEMGEEKGRRG